VSPRTPAISTLAVLLLGACASGEYDTTDAVVLEPFAVWGELTGPEDEQFGRVIAFDADSAGILYVADEDAPRS
jgi:hypothetical protein